MNRDLLITETVMTYNKSAQAMADYFAGIGARDKDIDIAIKLAGEPKNPSILEIGCGDGRDAEQVVKRTKNYVGFDISKSMIEIAKQKVPTAKFEVGDARTYKYPKNLDVILAFASLLHLDKTEVKNLFRKVYRALRPGGIIFISLKYRPKYEKELKKDRFGNRLFYFYNPELVTELAGQGFEAVYKDTGFVTNGNTDWFEIALVRNIAK